MKLMTDEMGNHTLSLLDRDVVWVEQAGTETGFNLTHRGIRRIIENYLCSDTIETMPYATLDQDPGATNYLIGNTCNCSSGATTVDLVTFQGKLMEEIKDTLYQCHLEKDGYYQETRATTLKTLVEVYVVVDKMLNSRG